MNEMAQHSGWKMSSRIDKLSLSQRLSFNWLTTSSERMEDKMPLMPRVVERNRVPAPLLHLLSAQVEKAQALLRAMAAGCVGFVGLGSMGSGSGSCNLCPDIPIWVDHTGPWPVC